MESDHWFNGRDSFHLKLENSGLETMGFTQPVFFLFLPVVWLVYWALTTSNLRIRNAWLLFASYLFYGYWDYRLLALILFSSGLDFVLAISIKHSDSKQRKSLFLGLSIALNLGLLGAFKYFNFFMEGFSGIVSAMGFQVNERVLELILPVGISFYTFQTLSYTIDVYRGQLKACTDWIVFFTYVAYFPQLVAGPIERASRLLPQLQRNARFSKKESSDGFRQMLWGYAKKMLVADGLAPFVEHCFSQTESASSLLLCLGLLLFSVQIYADFSGYSDIAIGISRMFGIKLMQNFRTPFLAKNLVDFWKRWHISLSTWFRDYVYIPMGGSRVSNPILYRNVLLVFLLSGLWHGANMTFVVWGLLHGLGYVFVLLLQTSNSKVSQFQFGPIFGPVITFIWVSFAWIFFRSPDMGTASLFTKALFTQWHMPFSTIVFPWAALFFSILILAVEFIHSNQRHGLRWLAFKSKGVRWSIYFLTVAALIFFRAEEVQFLYFQF